MLLTAESLFQQEIGCYTGLHLAGGRTRDGFKNLHVLVAFFVC
jgi:hypothetical protein